MRKRYERCLKDLDNLSRQARRAGLAANSLEDKLTCIRLQHAFEQSRRIIRLQWYSVDDAQGFLLSARSTP